MTNECKWLDKSIDKWNRQLKSLRVEWLWIEY